jgi:hypothetical protein
VTSHQFRDLFTDTDRRPANQLPCPVDPDQQAKCHQDFDRNYRARITGMNNQVYPLDKLRCKHGQQANQEQRVADCAPMNLAHASPTPASATEADPIVSPETSARSDTISALVKAVSAADARMR